MELQELIDKSKNIVFFGGAGVSTESGIPDFRSVDGLYNQKYDYPPETILSHSFFMRRPEEFFRFFGGLRNDPGADRLRGADLEPDLGLQGFGARLGFRAEVEPGARPEKLVDARRERLQRLPGRGDQPVRIQFVRGVRIVPVDGPAICAVEYHETPFVLDRISRM